MTGVGAITFIAVLAWSALGVAVIAALWAAGQRHCRRGHHRWEWEDGTFRCTRCCLVDQTWWR